MNTTRRRALAAIGAVAWGGLSCVHQADAAPPRICKIEGPLGAAADYSAARRGVAFLAMRDGKILVEDYPQPGGPHEAWEVASGAKTFTGAMAAAAAADGLLDLDEPAQASLPEWRSDPRKSRITLRQLLSLTSGLETKSVIGLPPTHVQALRAKVIHEPGAVFAYGPTSFEIFGEIMARKLRQAGHFVDPARWLQERVFDPIDVHPTSWRRGADGQPLMSQGVRLTARDWGRFGQWALDGARGVDPAVVRAWAQPSLANPGYGLSWWLLRPGLIGPDARAGIDGDAIGKIGQDEDIVMAAGAGDQRLYLLRKRRLVIVRQANAIWRSTGPFALKWRDQDFLKLILV